MRPRRRKLFVAGILLIAFACAAGLLVPRRPRNPVCNGKPLSAWLEQLPTTRMYPAVDPMVYASIHQIGSNAVPYLLAELQAKDSPLKLKLINFATNQSLIKIHFIPALTRRQQAVAAFRELGPEARSAFPQLATLFPKKPPADRTTIGVCLSYILPSSLVSVSIGPGITYTEGRSVPGYELTREELLKALGPPTHTDKDSAEYQLGINPDKLVIPIGLLNAALFITFQNDYVTGAWIDSARFEPPK